MRIATETGLMAVGTVINRNDEQLSIYRGFNDDIIGQLIQKSQEPDIQAKTPKDAAKRFATPEAFMSWIGKRRILYSLLHDNGELGGIVGFGPEAFNSNNYQEAATKNPEAYNLGVQASDTYLIRNYASNKGPVDESGNHKGSGTARAFTVQATIDYAQHRMSEEPTEDWPTFTGIHLETGINNIAAQRTYEKLTDYIGYTVIGASDKNDRVAMVLAPHDIRQLIRLEGQ